MAFLILIIRQRKKYKAEVIDLYKMYVSVIPTIKNVFYSFMCIIKFIFFNI